MAETVDQFRDELRALRVDLYSSGENTDIKLLASYLDRLIIALDDLAQNLDLMSVEVETMGESEEKPSKGAECTCPCCCSPMPMKKAGKSAKKKPAKKKPKKAAKKKGRR